MGIKKAKVLPEPVRAQAQISRLSSAKGMQAHCIGVGLKTCISVRAFKIGLESLKEINESTSVYFSRD